MGALAAFAGMIALVVVTIVLIPSLLVTLGAVFLFLTGTWNTNVAIAFVAGSSVSLACVPSFLLVAPRVEPRHDARRDVHPDDID